LQRKLSEFDASSAEVVAVSPDDAAATGENVAQLELTFPVLSDPALQGVDAFEVRHLDEPSGKQIPRPSAFVIDVTGKVRFAHVGENPRDRPTEEQLLEIVVSLNAMSTAGQE
jgi:peroxiredoxin